MSHKSPTGFAFGILLEIAAVVAVVSFLPRIDLRAPSASAASQPFNSSSLDRPAATEASILPVGWTQIDRGSAETSPTSYYQRRTDYQSRTDPQVASAAPVGSFPTQAPPLIETDAARPQYVEQRLDRASQQLLNSVGTAVTQTANSWQRPSTVPPPAPTTVRRQATNSAAPQPRPWIRY